MTRIRLVDHLARVRQRKQALGVVDTPAVTEAMRNKGEDRTPQKRAALTAMERRALEADREPVVAYF